MALGVRPPLSVTAASPAVVATLGTGGGYAVGVAARATVGGAAAEPLPGTVMRRSIAREGTDDEGESV